MDDRLCSGNPGSLGFAGLVLVAVASTAAAESDGPMRPVETTYTTVMPFIDVQACVIRRIAHEGKPVTVPIAGGIEVDQLTQTFLTKPTDPRFRVRVIDNGSTRIISGFYRHPVTQRLAAVYLKKAIMSFTNPPGAAR